MIDASLGILANFLNSQLSADPLNPAKIVLVSTLYDAKGAPLELATNHIVLFVTNISQNSIMTSKHSALGSDHPSQAPFIPDIDIALVSNYFGETYRTGLGHLTKCMKLLHDTPIMHKRDFADMPEGISKITIEDLPSEAGADNQALQILSPNHKPYALYSLRIIPSP